MSDIYHLHVAMDYLHNLKTVKYDTSSAMGQCEIPADYSKMDTVT